ncbi:MAG: ABC transporter permease [Clostridiales Family XIII bacterium]|jgi:ribose transport system permease protein|nr:ABC transporter permease [Clostridiales Family XIII bacterium]
MGANTENTIEKNSRTNIGSIIRSNTVVMLFVLAGVIVIFTAINPSFLTTQNIINILNASVIIGLLSIGQTFLIIAGHIDLSCGSIAALSGAIMAYIMRETGIAWPTAFLLAFLFAVLVGIINAVLVNVFELQPFIATLAMMSVCKGATYLLCEGKAIQIADKAFLKISAISLAYIPLPVIIMVVMFLVFGFILARTVFGRMVYMIGGNVSAARLAGIKPKRVSTILYIISAGASAVAGALYCSRMFSALPGAASGAEFDAITAVVLGGVAFIGGKGNMAGCFVGLIIIQFFSNGLVLSNMDAFWQVIAKGLLLIAALVFDFVRRKRFESRL